MSGRNVHKTDAKIFKLPQDVIQEDRGLKSCGTPQLVLASLTDVAPYKNDRTLIGAYKFDSMFVELEDANGVLTDAPGIEVLLPHQSDAVAWIIDWRQVVNGLGALAQGCYRVRVNWTKAGNSGWFYKGSYQLLEYTIENAAGTVRLYVVLNDFVRNQGINYKDSGAAGTVRFKGSFGYMQPNYETENNTLTDRTRHKVRIEALRSYELRTDYLHHCMTRLIDEETLLVANQIYISDHNAANHVQYYDFPVILSEDESPSFDYPQGSVFAKITAKFLDKKAWFESKYDGNIQGSTNMILQLPTTVASCAPASYTVEYENGTLIESGTVISGGSVTVEVPNPLYWELNYNGTDDVIFIPCTTNNAGTFASGSGTNVGTITISTDGITYGAISYPLTVTNGTTYYFKRSTASVTGVFTLTGEYA